MKNKRGIAIIRKTEREQEDDDNGTVLLNTWGEKWGFGAESKTESLSRINVHKTQPEKAETSQLPGDVVMSLVV